MKIKVHAQRKFAQGAFIPPSASAAPAERRGDVTPSKEENKHVYYNRMSAVSLLDIVAFQNMHSHTEPVVLLERLEEIQETSSQPLTDLDGAFASPIKNATTNGNANHTKSKPVKPLRYIRPKRTMGLNQRAQRPQNMHLRSRLGSSFKPKSRSVKKKCREKPSAAARALRRRRVPSPAESYDLDDDKPLTYIAQVLRRTVALRSDRNLRKRRGEELASTSKTTPTKVEHTGSDSEDTDSAVANGPTKPKQSNRPKSSHNASNGHKDNDGGGKASNSLPSRSVGTKDLSTHTQPPRNTPRARTTIQKDDIGLKGTSRVPSIVKSNKLLLKNKVDNRTRLNVPLQSNDLKLKGGSRGRAINKNKLKGASMPQTAIQNNETKLKTDLPIQSTSKELDVRHSVHTQLTTKNNDPNLRNSTEALHTSKTNNLNLRSSVHCQVMGQNSDLEHKITTRVQSTGHHKDSDPKNNSQGLTTHSNGLKLRSSWRAQQLSQNNDLKPRNSSQSAIQSQELEVRGTTQDQLVSQIELTRKNSLPVQSTSYSNDLSITLVQPPPPNQNNELNLGSTAQTQPALQTDLKTSTRSSPICQNNNLNSKSISRVQPLIRSNNLKLRSSSRNQSTGQNSHHDFQGSSPDHTTCQNNYVTLTTSAQTQQPSSQNKDDLSNSFKVGLSQNNDLDIIIVPRTQPIRQNNNLKLRSSLRAQQTNYNNYYELGDSVRAQPPKNDSDSSTQVRPISQNNNIELKGSLNTQQATQNNDVDSRNSLQGQLKSISHNLYLKSSSQALLTSQSNDVKPGSSSQTQETSQINNLQLRNSLDNNVGHRSIAQANPTGLDDDVGHRIGSHANPSSLGKSSLQANPISLDNDVTHRTSSQSNQTNIDNDIGARSSSQAISLDNGVAHRTSLQANSTSPDNDLSPRSSSQALPTSLNSDVGRISRSLTQISTPNTNIGHSGSVLVLPSTSNNHLIPRDVTQTRPMIQNNVNLGAHMGRIPNNDLQLGNNLVAQLMLQNSELDLIVNSTPLSPIQNYDWNFGSLRSPPTMENNYLGVRTNFRSRATVRNGDAHQRLDTRIQIMMNELGLGGNLQAPPPVRNIGVERRDNSTLQQNATHEPSNSTAQPMVRSDDNPRAGPRTATNQNDQTRTVSGAQPANRNIELGFGESSRPRPTIRNDAGNAGAGWGMRSFRNHSFHHRPRSTLLNDEIRPRPRPRLGHSKLDHRVPHQAMRHHARLWSAEANGERSREQQERVESLAAASRAARAERMAAVAGDRERAMTLDEALRECVLTAQSVTAEEVKPFPEGETEQEEVKSAQTTRNDTTGMQRRQAIAARQQQLSEGSPPLRRAAARRSLNTDTPVNGHQRTSERELVVSPHRTEAELEPEPGPSKLGRKKQISSPGDTGDDAQAVPCCSRSEPEARQEPQPDPEPELPKMRRKMPPTPEDPRASERAPDMEAGPSKRQRKKTPSLISGMLQQSRLRASECQPDFGLAVSPTREQTASELQHRPWESSEVSSKTTKDNTYSSMAPASPRLEPAMESAVAGISADPTGSLGTHMVGHGIFMAPPRAGLWPDTMIMPNLTDPEPPHFKVPRIPAARKSVERRAAKVQGSEQDDTPTSPTAESSAAPTQIEQEELTMSATVFTPWPKVDTQPFPCREELAEPIIQPKNACLSKHYTTVRSIVLATDTELNERCGNCIYCTRVEKIRKLSNLVQSQRKAAVATNEVYDFDADKEDSHENTRLYNFRQNRKPKLLEPVIRQDAPKDPVYLDVLPPQNQHIIEITSVPMPNQNKPMLRARLIRKTDANLENEFSLIEHENLLDQLLEIKIANSDQAAKKTTPVETEEPVAGPSNVEPVQAEVTDSADDVELNYETDDSSEFLARLQTRLNTRKKTEQTSLRAKASEKASLSKKPARTEAKKSEPVRKAKALRKGQAELPKIYMSGKFSHCFREAPVFHPTEEEFLDPLAYFEKIYPLASQFGLCKVVAPEGFKPKCTITDDVRFNVANQYISRLYCRWGAASKEMCAIKAYLAEQKVFFTRPPLIEGIELNLPKLYRTVQRHGGLKKVIEKKRWGRVAEDMRFPRGPRSAKRIDQLYVKHLLPYDTLSSAERRELMDTVEHSWNRNYNKMLNRASNPLHRQKRLMGESESSDDVDTDEDANLAYALAEAEDCVVTGRCMKLSVFKKVATNLLCTLFPHTSQPTPEEVEQEYWTLVSGAAEHVCVNAASIDTGEEGYGFPRAKHDPYSKHPWNLKMFSQNSGNVLRSLGPVLGVTVPTLHLGMVFATSCWHRDPHGLPWIEYMHHGPPKIWYGIPNELSAEFRKAVESLCPTSCQNKSIWLPSDITMIPPHLLHEARVPLSRVVQKPGEFIVVCPKAYSSSIATGYTESESVYFAPTQWLTDVSDVFSELRASCEPTMFSLSQLLLAVAMDARTPLPVLAGVSVTLRDVVAAELGRRDALTRFGIELSAPEQNRASCSQARKRPAGAWNVREQDECEVCRTTLYLSKVTGLTSKRSSLCLEHALRLIDKEKEHYARNLSDIVATIFVFRAELEDAVRRVERRLWK